ncbi:hypothetical protein K469DRAFT_709463 [Zopfia rhizophila CBS 207.26]|uniref:Uncharacterized protein n=1 Tax=Zopfia rhizophila CBS 207.26 TaxID=1314779 RepID=A0A6A6EV59_9PEZI|nr:hypothetical protein K469DRAFT_709463 [Zopfia rhizophila CBS 207.26]
MPSATPVRGFLRTAARYLSEPHPMNRSPVTQTPHTVPYSIYGKRVLRAGAFYVPMGCLILGWPIAASAVLKKTGV